MQPVFLWNCFDFAVLWLAGVGYRHCVGGGPHCAFFRLEFRGLPKPHAPLLWIGALFFLTFFTSSKARRVAILTKVAQINPRRYAAARCAAVFLSTLLLTAVCFVQAALYYGCYFGWYGWGALLLPALATLFPPLVFAVGSGWLLGQIRPWLAYVWMAVPFLCVLLPLPDALELWNGRFFTHYPLGLGTLDPAFSLPLSAILAQCFLLAAGTSLLFFQARKR